MAQLAKRAQPKVQAAVLRTWLGGWFAKRRFGSRGSRCLSGCKLGEDDLRRYLQCPVLWRVGAWHLLLESPDLPQERTTAALLWELGRSKERLRSLALLIAVGYRARNNLRHAGGGQLDAPRLLHHTLQELHVGITED